MSLKARIVAYDKAAADARAALAAASPAPAPGPPPLPLPPVVLNGSAILDDDDSLSPFQDSPRSCASSVSSASSLETSPSSLLDDAAEPAPCRPNEHLAVLIPRELWKPDRRASHCDKYACRIRFSLFERKHHCRKCGGVFCHQCSARTTSLLDTTHLPFLLPPKGTPIALYASPLAPIHVARVCDDCFEQLHGYPTPRPRPATTSAPTPPRGLTPAPPPSLATSLSSLSSLPLATPPSPLPRPRVARAHTCDHLPRPVKTTKLEGDLDRYPLKDPSATCKAAGGGRWSPTPIPPRWDARLPDGRLCHEAEADRRAAARRRRLANPVIVDGPIRVRRPHRHHPELPPVRAPPVF